MCEGFPKISYRFRASSSMHSLILRLSPHIGLSMYMPSSLVYLFRSHTSSQRKSFHLKAFFLLATYEHDRRNCVPGLLSYVHSRASLVASLAHALMPHKNPVVGMHVFLPFISLHGLVLASKLSIVHLN